MKEIINNFKNKKILVIGDIILDKYVFGDVARISPEAPIPILEIKKEEYRLGGAANVAANISTLGGITTLIGGIGDDKNGKIIKNLLKKNNINFIPVKSEKTTIKTRYLGSKQQLLRTDDEDKKEKKVELPELQKFDTVVISDYAKGIVTGQLFEKLNHKNVIINLKPKNANICKNVSMVVLNELESKQITNVDDVYSSISILYNKFKAKIIITRGEKGMLIMENKNIVEIPTKPKEVCDVSGAGDTVISTLALASDAPMEKAATLANYAAGIVIGKLGTSTISQIELKNVIEEKESKIKTREELRSIIEDLKSKNKVIAWTNGCFDILHQGHVHYLKEAKKQGDILIVGLNSDESIKKLKGQNRPIINQDERAEILASLGCVDYVTIFPELRVTKLLELLKPDVYVKASDYDLNTINKEEKMAIKDYKGKICFIPIKHKISTTDIINRIKK